MKKVLVIGLVFPEPNSSAAGTRMLQLVLLFKEQGYEVVFASAAQETEYSFDLNSISVEKRNIELNNSSFDLFVKDLNPEIVVFDRFISEEQFGWRVAKNSPNSMRILDTEDLHCLRYARQKSIKSNNTFKIEDLLSEESALREIASIYRCDLSLMISDFEMEVLSNVFKIDSDLLFYLPMFYVPKNDFKSYDERNDFIFIGNFLHQPNYDAVLQLKTIWKKIRNQLPAANLKIYGSYVPDRVTQLHNEKEGFLIEGRAINAFEVIEKAKLLLAPLRFGAGIKGKLLEAMMVGTPSITTSIGSEGISNESWNGFIEDDLEDFISCAINLYSNKTDWEAKQNVGKEILLTTFKKEKYNKIFEEKITRLFNQLNNHRSLNFIGKLLYQNQFLSIKYMSKWIEEKNKSS